MRRFTSVAVPTTGIGVVTVVLLAGEVMTAVGGVVSPGTTALTARGVEPTIAPMVAPMVELPAAAPVATPAGVMVAAPVLLDHSTTPVRSWLVPSVSTPVAVKPTVWPTRMC